MSMFYCFGCDKHIDSDNEDCEVDPKDATRLMCIECFDELENEGNPLDGPGESPGHKPQLRYKDYIDNKAELPMPPGPGWHD